MTSRDTYSRLIDLLAGARYRVMDHEPEGRTDAASAIRGHRLEQAAKCMVVVIRSDHGARYVLAVIPGHRRIDYKRLRRLLDGRDATLAPPADAERLAGCVTGSIIPFSFHHELELVVDPDLLEQPELFFNAARLDRSIALTTEDYVALAQPFVKERISRPAA